MPTVGCKSSEISSPCDNRASRIVAIWMGQFGGKEWFFSALSLRVFQSSRSSILARGDVWPGWRRIAKSSLSIPAVEEGERWCKANRRRLIISWTAVAHSRCDAWISGIFWTAAINSVCVWAIWEIISRWVLNVRFWLRSRWHTLYFLDGSFGLLEGSL